MSFYIYQLFQKIILPNTLISINQLLSYKCLTIGELS